MWFGSGTMRIEEKIVISELNRGNRKVLEALFREYYPTLVKYAEGFVFKCDVAEDIVQGLFVDLWERSGEIRFTVSIKAYLYRSTRNRCLNHLRDLSIRDNHKLLYLEAFFNSQDHDHRAAEEIAGKISSAIDRLPARMARVFRMKYLQEMKIMEIAQNLDISENSVKKHLSRGKERLRKELFMLAGNNF